MVLRRLLGKQQRGWVLTEAMQHSPGQNSQGGKSLGRRSKWRDSWVYESWDKQPAVRVRGNNGKRGGFVFGDLRRPVLVSGRRGVPARRQTLLSPTVSLPSSWQDITRLQGPVPPGQTPAVLGLSSSEPTDKALQPRVHGTRTPTGVHGGTELPYPSVPRSYAAAKLNKDEGRGPCGEQDDKEMEKGGCGHWPLVAFFLLVKTGDGREGV